MDILEEERSGVLLVTPMGRVDSNTAGELERKLIGHIDRGSRRLVIDMSGVDYMSSAGLRVMLLAAKRLREGGALVLCGMGESVRQIFELAGFLPIFAIEATRDLALARLAGEGR
jgi:anti-anti-sigma factor